jgi:hypothetical protein
MDFYQVLKSEVEKSCSALAKDYSDAKRKLAKTRNRLLDEKALLVRLEEQKEKLTSLADDTLAGSDNDYAKFKVSLKKVSAEIESTGAGVETLESKIIPAQQRSVELARGKLNTALHDFCISHKGGCEAEMNGLFDGIVKLQDGFLDAFDRFYAGYGLQFVIHELGLIPKPTHERLDKLAIVARSPQQREAAMKASTKPTMPPESMQDAKAPAAIPPDAGSQAVDAQSASGEAVETTPETTTLLTGIADAEVFNESENEG